MAFFEPLEKISSWRRISTAMWGEHNSPQVLGFDDVDVTNATALIEECREKLGVRVTITHIVIATVAKILNEYPDFNALLVRGKPVRRKNVDVFVQVSVKGAQKGDADLSGVKVKKADELSIIDIATYLNNRADRVRKGKDKEIEETKRLMDSMPAGALKFMLNALTRLTFDMELDLSKLGVKPDPFGSAMVTNVGGFGVSVGFAPLIPAARTPIIFLLGRVEDKVVAMDGEAVIRKMIRMSGTFDHRLLDGYQIGLICSRLKQLIEEAHELRPPELDA